MNRILVVSNGADTHTDAVLWGLRQLGAAPVLWDWSRFPCMEDAQLDVTSAGQAALRFSAEGTVHHGPFDVIWWRRPGKPQPPSGAHPDDRPMIVRQSEQFLESVLPFAAHAGTRWVNEPAADRLANNKARQLIVARKLGFTIPDTSMGNSPDTVRACLAQHGGTLAHKAFVPMTWNNEDGSVTYCRTAPIEAAHLASDFAVRACPSIYQQLLDKAYELRVTVMGARVLAARIDSQRDGPTTDWRLRGYSNVAATELPADVARRCLQLCRALQLEFGCIDLVVTPSGETVFLEVNPAGQFLFVEQADPSIHMLDAFCRFLAGAAAGPGDALLRFGSYCALAAPASTGGSQALPHHDFQAA